MLTFNFYTYVFAAAVLVVCYLLFRGKEIEFRSDFRLTKVWKLITVMSVCLFLNSWFLTLSAVYLSSVSSTLSAPGFR